MQSLPQRLFRISAITNERVVEGDHAAVRSLAARLFVAFFGVFIVGSLAIGVDASFRTSEDRPL